MKGIKYKWLSGLTSRLSEALRCMGLYPAVGIKQKTRCECLNCWVTKPTILALCLVGLRLAWASLPSWISLHGWHEESNGA